jgi:hypothetical protein
MAVKGGRRPGAGRKSKAAELKMADAMDLYCTTDDFWGIVHRLMLMGDMQAIKLWANYRFGMPKQNVDMALVDPTLTINVNWDDDEKFIHQSTTPALKPAAGTEGG